MHRDSPAMPVIVVIVSLLIMLDARILGGIICIPTGILMLKQCHQKNTEDSEKYDLVAVIGGIGMVFFGICVLINYIFIK